MQVVFHEIVTRNLAMPPAAAAPRRPGIFDNKQAPEFLGRHLETPLQRMHRLGQGRSANLADRAVLGDPGRDRDRMRTAEGQESRRGDAPLRIGRRLELQCRIAPRSPAPRPGGAASDTVRR
jgi:hypothetical protein